MLSRLAGVQEAGTCPHIKNLGMSIAWRTPRGMQGDLLANNAHIGTNRIVPELLLPAIDSDFK